MMGKPEGNTAFQHFSHGHQFLYINKLPSEGNAICYGCKLSILPGKFYYKCETCSFFLHEECFDMPKNLQHLVDPIHHLTLLATVPSSSIDHYSATKCNACGKVIAGFYYACAKCSTYYHTLCLLALPLLLELPSHCHKLDLEFCPPYDFECDLCKKPSYKGWLYHCSSCEFDAHVSCAITHKGADIENQLERKTEKTGNKCHELMELLLIYMRGSEEISVGQESFQDQLQHPAQQTPSYQSSDGCFSIDLAKSQLLNDGQTGSHMRKEALEIRGTKEKSNVAYITLPKGVKLPSSNEIGSEVWMELGKEMEKAYQTNDSNKLCGPSRDAFYFTREKQDKGVETMKEALGILESEISGKNFFGGDDIGYVDIVIGWSAYWLQFVEVAANYKAMDSTKYPHMDRWMKNFLEVPIIKDNIPPYDGMLSIYQAYRKMCLLAFTSDK